MKYELTENKRSGLTQIPVTTGVLDDSPEARKRRPMYRGLLSYFPHALEDVAGLSYAGSVQHHPDKPMHWDKDKSSDHEDALLRHLAAHARGEIFDTDGIRHLTKVAWRALAASETQLTK